MADKSLFLGHDFHRALNDLPGRLENETYEAIERLYKDRASPGLNVELLYRCNGDLGVYSARVNLPCRLIFAEDADRIMVLWVDHHDEAYRWADRHRAQIPERMEKAKPHLIERMPEPVPSPSSDDPLPLPDPNLLDDLAARGYEHYFAALDESQRTFVEYGTRRRKGLSFVTAGVGTGKTSIAIWRALRQAEQQEQGHRGVLYLCYNRVLMQTVRKAIDALAPPEMARQIEVNYFHRWAGAYLQQRGESVYVDEDGQWLPEAVLSERRRLPKAEQGALPNNVVVQEIEHVLRPNQFDAIDGYLNLTRPESQGLPPLRRPQRQTIWDLYQRIRQRDDFRFGWNDLIEHARAVLVADADPPRYRAVIVDEGQDCSPVMARLAKTLVAGEEWRLLVLADPAQELYRGTFLWSRREFGPRGGQARFLLRPYRSTRQIHALTASLYANVDETRREIDAMPEAQRDGPLPRFVRCLTAQEGLAFVVRSIRKEIKNERAASQMAVLTGTNRRRDDVLAALRAVGVPALIVDRGTPPDSTSVSLMTVHAAKGLDFASVYLLDPELGRAAIDIRRGQLYVALTRSSRDLCIVHCAGGKSLLDDLDPECYERVDCAP